MKCCGREVYDNGDNYRCGVCGKRKPKINPEASRKCPECKNMLYMNFNNMHCGKCGYRRYV